MIFCYIITVSLPDLLFTPRAEIDTFCWIMSLSEHLIIILFYLFDFSICICALPRIIRCFLYNLFNLYSFFNKTLCRPFYITWDCHLSRSPELKWYYFLIVHLIWTISVKKLFKINSATKFHMWQHLRLNVRFLGFIFNRFYLHNLLLSLRMNQRRNRNV